MQQPSISESVPGGNLRSVEFSRVTWGLVCGLVWCLLVFAIPSNLTAQQLRSGLSTQEAYVDSEVIFRIEVRNAREHTPPVISAIDGLTIESAGTPSRSSKLLIMNGRREQTTTITYAFRITPKRVGTYTIPPIEIQIDGRTQSTEPHTMVVHNSETGDLLFAEIACEADRAYVGQAVEITLKVWVRPFADRSIPYRFTEADMWQQFSRQTNWGMFAERLEELGQNSQRPGGQEVLRKDEQGVSRAYLLYEIDHTIYPKRPGQIDPGDVRVVINYPTKVQVGRSGMFGNDFFGPSLFDQLSGRRSIQIAASRPIAVAASLPPIEVLDVPSDGRPADYRGAVGNYRFLVQADPKNVRVGDPINLKMVVQGDGPMELVEAPPLSSIPELTRDFKIDAQALAGFVQDDAKLFTTSIRPLREDVTEIPALPFSYFDPEAQAYRTDYSQPIPIAVAMGESLSLDSIVARRKPTSVPTDATESANSDILPLEAMLEQVDAPRSYRPLFSSWLPFVLAPLGCLAYVLWWKRDQISLPFARRSDPCQSAIQAVQEATTASQIRDALELARSTDAAFITAENSVPFDKVSIQQACDAATFGGRGTQHSVTELKRMALQALQHTSLFLICLLFVASDHLTAQEKDAAILQPPTSTSTTSDEPPLHLTSQQVKTLLQEALDAQQRATELEATDAVAARAERERAIAKYELVIESGFRSVAVFRNLADARAEQGDWEQALVALVRAQRYASRDTSLLERVAQIRQQLGQDVVPGTLPSSWLGYLKDFGLLGAWSGLCLCLTAVIMSTRWRNVPSILLLAGLAIAIGLLARIEPALDSPAALLVESSELRAADGEEFSMVGNVEAATWVNVLDRRGSWLLVEADEEQAGWVPASRLETAP